MLLLTSLCLLCFIEMSLGSDRDSVIESDIDDGDEVREDDMYSTHTFT